MSWTDYELRCFVAYYILAGFSISGAILVATTIVRSTSMSSPFTKIVLCLHLSLCLDEISLLPYAYSNSLTMCSIMEIVHYYVTLVNYCSLFILVQAHLFNTMEHWRTSAISVFIEKYGVHIVFIFPLIVFFRFMDSGFDAFAYPWCIIKPDTANPLYFMTYFFWMYVLLGGSLLEVIVSTYYIYLRTDAWMTMRYFSTIGLYMTIAIIGLFPTFVISIVFNAESDDDPGITPPMITFIPVYVSGILYTGIFFYDREAIMNFDLYRQLNRNISKADVDLSVILGLSQQDADAEKQWMEESLEAGFQPPRASTMATVSNTKTNTSSPMKHERKTEVAMVDNPILRSSQSG